MGVHDLNFGLPVCDAHGFERPGVMYERGQDAVRASDGVRAVEDLRSNRRAAQRRRGVRTLGCADLFRVMAFAQLTWRESLRDIEAFLEAKNIHYRIDSPQALAVLNTRYTQFCDPQRKPAP